MFLLVHKRTILDIHWLLCLLSLLFIPATVVYLPLQAYWLPLGKLAGQLAVYFLFIVLLPGIMKRFQVTGTLKNWQIILMAYRRRLGITMFLLSAFHYLWLTVLPAAKFNGSILPQTNANLAGFIGFILLTPLFLTSNDFSLKLLGKCWQILHKLVYPITLLVLLHLILKPAFNTTSVFAFITCLLLLLSLVSTTTKKVA